MVKPKREIKEFDKSSREPILETESFRVWKLTKAESEIEKAKPKDESAIEIDMGVDENGEELKMMMTGFSQLRHKETDKLIFAFKFKHDERAIAVYLPQDDYVSADLFIDEKIAKTMNELIKMADTIGYSIIDMNEAIDNIKNQRHILDKLDK